MKKKYETEKANENGTKPFRSLKETIHQEPHDDKKPKKKRWSKLSNYMSRDGGYDWTEAGSENPD